jgi:hypothetical protein
VRPEIPDCIQYEPDPADEGEDESGMHDQFDGSAVNALGHGSKRNDDCSERIEHTKSRQNEVARPRLHRNAEHFVLLSVDRRV